MNRNGLIHLVSAAVLLCGLSTCASPSIEGVWRHSDKAAWIEITFSSGIGSGTVDRHDSNEQAEGALLLRDIRATKEKSNEWQGAIYSAEVDDFVEAKIVAAQENTLVISVANSTNEQVVVLRLVRD